MNDKNESEKLMEELKRIGEGFNKFIESIGEALNKLFYPKEDEWDMKFPFEYGDEYYLLKSFGDFQKMEWTNHLFDELALMQGNTFPTQEAIELEIKRRNLLTRFKAFRDECNGDWKINWDDVDQGKFIIKCGNDKKLYVVSYWTVNEFNVFGYFKDGKDAQRAIDLFGDEIKELFVEGE